MKIINNIERIERKWSLHQCTKAQFHIAISRSKFCFVKEYDSRKVNSIYFDDSDLNSLNENLDGNTFKAKYRIRWYGNLNKINMVTFRSNNNRRPPYRGTIIEDRLSEETMMKDPNFLIIITFKEKHQAEIITTHLN